MHSKKKVIYIICSCCLILMFYICTKFIADRESDKNLADTQSNQPAITDNNTDFSKPISSEDDQSAEGTHAEQVAAYAEDFLANYHDTYPGSYPVISGSLGLFGDSWSCVMWDGERSEVILIYYNKESKSVQEKSFVITKEMFMG